MAEKITYNFDCIDPTDYELVFNVQVKNRLFQTIFSKAKTKLIRKGKTAIKDADPKTISKFAIPQQYHNLMKIALTKQIVQVSNIIATDKILMLNNRVSEAHFERDSNEDWLAIIKVVGQYADKR